MRRATAVFLSACLLGPPPAFAEKVPDAFREEFEKTVTPRKKFPLQQSRGYAVVLATGAPTASCYGLIRQSSKDGVGCTYSYRVQVVEGVVRDDDGKRQRGQNVVEYLERAEVVEIVGVGYKDGRIDVEVETGTRPVKRKHYRKLEPFRTTFQYQLPFPPSKVLGPADVPEILEYVARCLKPFPDEASARSYRASLRK